MMAWMGPPQFHSYNGRAAPNGWPGSWPPTAPMGYPGPPPPPPGVDSRSWLGGQWQINPMFQGAPAASVQPHTAWAPHPSWGAAGAAGAAPFNPYKRIPNPGDANYWKTELLKNPLGLENMITAEELMKNEEEKRRQEKANEESNLPQTPWLWVPKELSKSDEPPPSKEPNVRDGREVRSSQASSQPQEHRHHHPRSNRQPQSASAVVGSGMQDQQSIERHQRRPSQAAPPAQAQPQQPQHRSQSQHIPSSSKNDIPVARHRQTESLAQSGGQPSSAPAAVSSFSQYYLQQQQTQSRSPEPQTRSASGIVAPNPPRTPTHISTASAQIRTPGDNGDDAFSTQQQLKPTFSSNIIRTPLHYTGSASSLASATTTPTRKPTREGSKDDYRSSRAEPSPLASPPRQERHRSRSRFRARNSDSSDDDSPPPRPHAHGPIYGPPTPVPGHRNDSGATTVSMNTNPTSSRESSLASMTSVMSSLTVDTPPTSASSSVFLSTFSDEPAGLLSPLIVGGPTPSKTSPRELGRSHTYPLISTSSQSPPSTIPAIPEERSPVSLSRTSSVSKTPRRSPSTHTKTPKTPRTPNSVTRSRTYPTLDPLSGEPPVIPPMPSPQPGVPPMPSPNRPVSAQRAPSPSRAPSRNPLPPPPMPSAYPVSSASASAAMTQDHHRRRTQSQYEQATSRPQSSATVRPPHSASSPAYQSQSQPPPPPPQPLRKVRYGFWNRRGDHLLVQPASNSHSPSSPASSARGRQYIVYAPRNMANPEELAHYPVPTEGWMNHRGYTLRYDPSVKELPDSLPSHGEPPIRPYEEFVRYVNI